MTPLRNLKTIVLLTALPIAGCSGFAGLLQPTLPQGVLQASNCQVSGAGTLGPQIVGTGLNFQFQCAGTTQSPGTTPPSLPAPVTTHAAAAVSQNNSWPKPPPLPPMPPLR